MKRDWDLIRRILLKLEETGTIGSSLYSDEIPHFDSEKVAYHFKILADSKLITGRDNSTLDRADFVAQNLTWQGHELLDQIRNDSIWQKIKGKAREKSIDLSLDVIKQIASNLISSML